MLPEWNNVDKSEVKECDEVRTMKQLPSGVLNVGTPNSTFSYAKVVKRKCRAVLILTLNDVNILRVTAPLEPQFRYLTKVVQGVY